MLSYDLHLNGGFVKSWVPGCLIQDDEDVAYQPKDKEGKRLAAYLEKELRLIMWRARMTSARIVPPDGINCRCVIKPISDV